MYYFTQHSIHLIVVVLDVATAELDVAATQAAQDQEQSHRAHQVGKLRAPNGGAAHVGLATLVLGDIRGVATNSGFQRLGRHVEGSTQTDHHTNRNAHHLAVHG